MYLYLPDIFEGDDFAEGNIRKFKKETKSKR